MKNYKFLVPIILVVIFIGSIYMLYDTKATQMQAYKAALIEARGFREKDIQVDAEDYYMQALELNPSLDLYVEIGEFYLETEQSKKAIEWGETTTAIYPENVKGYEFLMGIYHQKEDYIECFDIADVVEKRKLKSVFIDEIIEQIQFTFYFNGEYDEVGIFSGGLCPVRNGQKWGYVNQSGVRAIDLQFSYAGPFAQGLAPVTDGEGNSYYIDTAGNKKHVVLGVEKIEKLGLIERELFSMYNGSEWMFYNTNHELVFGSFEDASAIGNGVAAVKSNGKWSLVDRSGTKLVEGSFANVVMDEKGVVYRNERLFVSGGEGYQMINSAGEKIGSENYDEARIFNDATYAAVKMDGKWGFVDKDGEKVINPQYEDARSFANGFAAVKKNGLWGFINTEGKIVIEFQFDGARDFNSNGCVFVLTDSEWELLRLYKSNH